MNKISEHAVLIIPSLTFCLKASSMSYCSCSAMRSDDHILLCDCTVLTSMSRSLCWNTSSVLLNISFCVYVLYQPACHDHCAGWRVLYYWTSHAVFLYCTYQQVMIIVLDDELCIIDHILLCVCRVLTRMPWSLCWMMSSVLLNIFCCASVMYLPACHDHYAGWQALYSLPCPAVWPYCPYLYQHVMIIVLDDALRTADDILLCIFNVLTSMSWSLCWTVLYC